MKQKPIARIQYKGGGVAGAEKVRKTGQGREDPASLDYVLSNKHFFAACLGNVVESYDWCVFGQFADQIAKAYFPEKETEASHIHSVSITFVVFFAAFIVRPIGGVLWGHIGDVYGREKAIKMTILIMSVSSVALGSVPRFDQIGYWAVVFLVFLRLVQGISMGGEWIGTYVIAIESAPAGYERLYGALATASGTAGFALAQATAAAMSYLPRESLEMWGWRVAFYIGGFIAFVGWYLRQGMESSTEFKQAEKVASPIKAAFAQEWDSMLAVLAVVAPLGCMGYLGEVWLAEWITNLKQPPVKHAYTIGAIAAILSIFTTPLAAIYFEKRRVSPLKAVISAIVIAMFAAPPFYYLISQSHGTVTALVCYRVVLSFAWLSSSSSVGLWLVRRIKNPAYRFTALGISYNFAQATFGGSAPAIASELYKVAGPVAPAFYLSGICLFFLFVLLFLYRCKPQRKSHSFSLFEQSQDQWQHPLQLKPLNDPPK